MKVLGIETSCDETAAAVVTDERRVLSDVVLSQIEDHRRFGGVVPEIAARAHLQHLDGLIARALADAGTRFTDLDGIAATAGPGLIGGVLVGVMTAKAAAAVHELPFLAINHLEAHALTARLSDGIEFPYLLLLVSGGHCQILIVEGVGRYRRLGTTIDDALGEAFDKTAKLLDLGFPGGPAVEAAARGGDPTRFLLPRPMKGRPGCHFSFSGLKTAVAQLMRGLPQPLSNRDRSDIAAAFQAAIGEVVADRLANALSQVRTTHPKMASLVAAGGVAANAALRDRLHDLCGAHGWRLHVPPPRLCTDNGAMIAWAGVERLRLGLTDPLDFPARPRWPLDPDAAPAGFAGVKA
jgi:N6-L-threonylcarbamoyladenine synthase